VVEVAVSSFSPDFFSKAQGGDNRKLFEMGSSAATFLEIDLDEHGFSSLLGNA
jgi:hypothetical protein